LHSPVELTRKSSVSETIANFSNAHIVTVTSSMMNNRCVGFFNCQAKLKINEANYLIKFELIKLSFNTAK